jgi:hypothetical protein
MQEQAVGSVKDLTLILEEGDRNGLELGLARAVEQLVASRVLELGDLDYSSLIDAEIPSRRPNLSTSVF